jgi:predicted Ser/Thr protein kinase
MFAFFGLGLQEVLILACVGLPMFLGTIVVLLAAIRYLSKPTSMPPAPAAQATASPSLSHQDVLRTRYFLRPVDAVRTCPRCRAPLAADAPEGLCPACLLAGGLEAESLPPTSSGHGTPAGAGAVDTAALAAAFPHLEIVELLGQGGMGTVFKVRQKNLDRLAALKVIPPQAALDPTFAERFAREARALARLNHASIVTVYDFGQAGGFYFLLMEYIDGPNLRQLMRSERIAPREALAIVPQICDALQYAHDQGIVHRDIKPENVLIDRTGRVKIADFGLAKLLGTSPAEFTLTHTQQVMGTPRYMAPEQIEHPSEVDHRADIYSLGVVIYEMLTGELPIGRFAPPSQKVEVDVRLDEIVLRSLEKEPARRYQRASEVKTEIESVTSLPATQVPGLMPTRPGPSAVQMPTQWDSSASPPPLGMVLAIAIGMVLGMLMIGGGAALAIAGLLIDAGEVFRLSLGGSGIGVAIGGAGAFFGSYNSYRQLGGAVDLMRSPEVTWFDYVMRVYLLIGFGAFLCGVLLAPAADEKMLWVSLVTVGAILSFQGALFVLWRWGARQQALAAGGTPGQRPSAARTSVSVRPKFALAVAVPTLAIAAVWALVLADMHFMTNHWPRKSEHVMGMRPSQGATKSGSSVERPVFHMERAVVTAKGEHRASAIRALWIAACISVTVVFIGLALWRAIGPRHAGGGTPPALAVAPPFGHAAWPLAVAVISFATFVLPWVRLHLDDVAGDPDFKVQLTLGTDYSGAMLRQITGMPQGERYVALGHHNAGGAAAAILFAAGAMLAAGMSLSRPLLMRMQGGLAVAAGVLAVVILLAFSHRLGERDESLIHDAITQRGLSRAFSGRDVGPGSGPALVLQEYVNVSPALGFYLAAGMAGLLVLIGATQWSWHVGAPESDNLAPARPLAAAVHAKPILADDREAIRQQVRGPGMGLIVSGVVGLVPVVVLCVAIPVLWVSLLPSTMPEKPQISAGAHEFGAAPFIAFPIASVGSWQPPVIVAQESPTMETTMPVWAGLFGVLIVGLVFLGLPASILLILGGVKMRQLRSYGLVYLAAIVALVPLGPQWPISLPMGIWALAVLGKPEVKGAFE